MVKETIWNLSVFQAAYLYFSKITEIKKMTKTVHANEKYQMFVK